LVELFPTRTRYTGIAIGYNLGQALLGGTAPLVGTALIRLTGNDLAPAFFLIGCAPVAGLACLFIKAGPGQPLDQVNGAHQAYEHRCGAVPATASAPKARPCSCHSSACVSKSTRSSSDNMKAPTSRTRELA